MKAFVVIWFAIIVIAVVGEIKCIVKAVNCNWDPIGKAEIVYTAASVTGFGAIVGYIDVKDK